MRLPSANAAGFTAIEVMIVLVVSALLLTLAAPSYLGVQLRVHRTAAVASLIGAANCQERIRAVEGHYDTRRCRPANNEHYRFRFDPDAQAQTRTFEVIAEPGGRQARDSCGALILAHSGERRVGDESAETRGCWSGR